MRDRRIQSFPSFAELLGWSLVLLLLWWPVDHAAALAGDSAQRLRNAGASLAAVLAVFSLSRLLPGAAMRLLLVCGLLAALGLRMLHLGLVKFSGAGFTLEFFLHLEWQSVVLAVEQYPWLLVLLLVLLSALATLLWRLLRRARPAPRAAALMGLVMATGVAGLSRAGFPEYQLLRAWQSWSGNESTLAAEAVERWRRQAWVDIDAVPKRFLQAYAPQRPLNLVLVYLESVGAPLIEHPSWPGLMPRLAALQAEHALLPSIHASGFITIEGLINSQCGSLLPFQRGSDTYASGEQVFENMVCLGDVLAKAGYAQTYMGGAGMGFAGKGAFLAAHGYERLLGYEHWQSLDMHARPGTWGLADSDLFAQASQEIEQLRAAPQPFHLSLLTIGTHLPGYRYAECDAYPAAQDLPASERDFLDALHCTDQLLGRFVDQLRDSGALEDTLLVITADHHIFPNPDMRSLFGAAVEDRRLPLLALGPMARRPESDLQAAGYDLAPTVLDLLGIRHNARFILGRSLFDEGVRQRAYLPNRYTGVFEGRPVRPADGCAAHARDVALPLDACSHAELMQVLAATARQLSQPAPQLVCAEHARTGLQIDPAQDEPLQIWFAGQPQLERFTWNSRPLRRAQSGLYRLSVSPSGEVLDRQFMPADLDAEARARLAAEQIHVPEGSLSLLAWLPDVSDSAMQTGGDAQWLQELGGLLPEFSPGLPGAWWLRHGEGAPAAASSSGDGGLSLWLSPELCADVLAQR